MRRRSGESDGRRSAGSAQSAGGRGGEVNERGVKMGGVGGLKWEG